MTLVELRGSRLDDAWQRLMERPALRRAWEWGAPGAVVLLAAVLRLAHLANPHQLVFDETYYVKDAYTLWHLGYEGAWPAEPNPRFASGDTDIFTTAPAFVAHPPLGKWLIGVGITVFGAGDPTGWRVTTALAGILLVVVTMLIARHLFRSTLLTVIAGGLLAIDGNAIVMSRVSLLDGILALFALLGAYLLLLDRDWSRRRTADWIARREAGDRPTDWGPVLWWRPWMLAAAVAFGAATAVKWSGIYFLAVFGIYSVLSDAWLRRRAGIEFWVSGSLLRQGPASFLLMVPLAAAVYLASWIGWFVTSGGYYRHWIEDGGEAWQGALAWVPTTLQNWWHYQVAIYNYAYNESSPHGYSANPLTWLFLVRPTSMYYETFPGDQAASILGLANPIIWWAGTAAIFFCLYRVIRGLIARVPVHTEAFVLTGMAAGFLPWLLYLHRTVFQFYTIAFEPFLILALTVGLGALLGSRDDPERRRVVGLRTVGVFLAVCVLVSAWFLPMWTGMPVPLWFVRLHYWFPTWI